MKALAEFYERLCLLNARCEPDQIRWHPETRWIDPASLVENPSPVEAERLRSGSFRWMDATHVATGHKTKIPAQYLIPDFEAEEVGVVDAAGSTGAALGTRGDGGALRRGVFEVIERHAALPLSRAETLARRVTPLPESVSPIVDTLRRYKLEPYVFLLPALYDTPCVYVVVADASGVGPAVSLTTRAATTFSEAIADALLEALERRRPARIEELGRAADSAEPRIYPWEPIETLQEAQPLIDAAEPVPFSELAKRERTGAKLLEMLAADQRDVYSVDLTLPEVAAAGFEAIKMVIPGLGPIPA